MNSMEAIVTKRKSNLNPVKNNLLLIGTIILLISLFMLNLVIISPIFGQSRYAWL